jgi:hypothetical protein
MLTETNTSHTDKRCEKNLAGAPTLLQGFGGYTRGCASAPLRNSTTTKREGHPISKRQPLRVPNGYYRRGSGATVGDDHKGPLMARGKPLFCKITKRKQIHKPQITPRVVAAQYGEGPTTQIISAAHQAANLNTPRANFRPARGPGAAPQISASLEGYAPPRASLRLLARGLRAPSGKSPPRSRATRVRNARSHPFPRPEH